MVLNLTGVSPTAATHLTVWADGTPRPTVSNLNLAPGDTTANLAVVALSDAGRVRIRNSAGATHVLADVVGYLDTATTDPDRSGYHPRPPVRVLDTRTAANPLMAGEVRPLAVTAPSVGSIPRHASAVVATVTAVTPTADLDLRAWAHGIRMPATSNLNTTAGVTRANLAVIPVGADGKIDLRISSGSAHVVVCTSESKPRRPPHGPTPP